MLRKDICKRCINRKGDIHNGEERVWAGWNDDDDCEWRRGGVCCAVLNALVAVKAEVSLNCPYALEHLMSENQP